MNFYGMLSQMYEVSNRTLEKYEVPDNYPEWMIDQIVWNELQMVHTLKMDSYLQEVWRKQCGK